MHKKVAFTTHYIRKSDRVTPYGVAFFDAHAFAKEYVAKCDAKAAQNNPRCRKGEVQAERAKNAYHAENN